MSDMTELSPALPNPVLNDERAEHREAAIDRAWTHLQSYLVASAAESRAERLKTILPLVASHADAVARLDDQALDEAVTALKLELRRSRALKPAPVARGFALIRELSGRILSQRHYDVQILGAYALVQGMLAEMATGEGKTLTATLAAGTVALAGIPVHVVTVNDYLAKRDVEHLRPLYERLGLTVGTVISGQSPDERRAAYACDITYCTNKELAFDYLRDRIILGQKAGNLRLKLEALHEERPRLADLRMRGLHFAIVDEADSVLIDEARTPLIISATAASDISAETVAQALDIARRMETGRDFALMPEDRRVLLTRDGQALVRDYAGKLGGAWRSTVARDELARQALAALHLYRRDEQYLLRDGKIQIIDEYTGRVMPDRFWSDGLHQMIEHKEGCELSDRRATIARITFQRFFRRYKMLAGMSGTLKPVARELWSVYRLPTAQIPTHRPIQRILLPDVVADSEPDKWRQIVARVAELHDRGIPVMIGTRSVAASDRASQELTAHNLPHMVLNASQDDKEAQIVAEAGQTGRITIATNMAGRGTDIKVAPEALKEGGLHVIMSERHDARRIDLQLAGRCGRQGEPGCFQAILSVEDALMTDAQSTFTGRIINRLAGHAGPDARRHLIAQQQRRIERLHADMRASLLKNDLTQSRLLALSGQSE
jgi:preprotein translocase subunit SecA